MNRQDHGIPVISSKTEIKEYLKHYHPKLELCRDNYIKGSISFAIETLDKKIVLLNPYNDYPNNSSIIKDTYEISIEWGNKNQPYPVVKELGGKIISSFKRLTKKIPKIKTVTDLHMDEEDNSLCLCTPIFYETKYPQGIEIKDLIEDLIIPFLYLSIFLE